MIQNNEFDDDSLRERISNLIDIANEREIPLTEPSWFYRRQVCLSQAA
nr:hypothetical protein [Moraxella osloensis]